MADLDIREGISVDDKVYQHQQKVQTQPGSAVYDFVSAPHFFTAWQVQIAIDDTRSSNETQTLTEWTPE